MPDIYGDFVDAFNDHVLDEDRHNLGDTEIDAAIAALVDSSPATLDTLNELAAALGGDPNFATTITTLIGTKADDTTVVHKAGSEVVTGGKTFTATTTFQEAVTVFTSRIGSAMVSVDTGSAANPGVVVRGVAAQAANLQEWQDSAGTVLSCVLAGGNLGVGDPGSAAVSLAVRTKTTTDKGITVRAVVSQTGNLQEWQDSSGGLMSGITSAGELDVVTPGNGVLLTSPNGTRYRITVDDAGILTTAAA